MTVSIPLSQSGPPAAFAAALEAHRAALETHRNGPAHTPAPVAHPLLDSLVARVPAAGPVATRGPDSFQVVPYTIVDDTPPPLPPPTLEEKRAALLNELHQVASATRNAILSPAKANLLNLDVTAALNVPETSRTPAQVATIAAFVAFNDRCVEIGRTVAEAAVEIEDLSEATIDTWKVPTL